MQDSGSLAVFKVTARDQGHYKGPSGAFVTYCNISCLILKWRMIRTNQMINKILFEDYEKSGNIKTIYQTVCKLGKCITYVKFGRAIGPASVL